MQKVGYGKRKLQVVDYTQSVNGVMQVQCNAAEFEPLLKMFQFKTTRKCKK
jgi:hypothetical protein